MHGTTRRGGSPAGGREAAGRSHSAAMPVAASVVPLPMKATPAAALPAARPRLMAFLPAGGEGRGGERNVCVCQWWCGGHRDAQHGREAQA